MPVAAFRFGLRFVEIFHVPYSNRWHGGDVRREVLKSSVILGIGRHQGKEGARISVCFQKSRQR